MADEAKTAIPIGEKTATNILEAQRMAQTARAMINAQVETLREVHGLSDSWVPAQMSDGKLYLVDSTPEQGQADQQ